MTISAFIEEIKNPDQEYVVRFIQNTFTPLLREERFHLIDEIFRWLDIETTNIHTSILLLRLTIGYQDKLNNRQLFYSNLERFVLLHYTPSKAEELLLGLD